MVNIIMMIIIGIMLFGAGIADIKALSISRAFIIALFIVCTITVFLSGSSGLIEVLSGTLVGICAIGMSVISDGQIGRGDGFVIAAIGLVLGFRGSLTVVCIASIIMCVIAVVLLVLKKGNKKTKLPFIPALFAGYMVFIIGNIANTGVVSL